MQIQKREVRVLEDHGGLEVVTPGLDEVQHGGDGWGEVVAQAETVRCAGLKRRAEQLREEGRGGAEMVLVEGLDLGTAGEEDGDVGGVQYGNVAEWVLVSCLGEGAG